MPISLRLSLLSVLVAILGFLLIVYAHVVNGWNAIAYFAWGLIMAAIGLISTLLLAGISMIKKGPWRQFALVEILIALILLVCLVVLWKWA